MSVYLMLTVSETRKREGKKKNQQSHLFEKESKPQGELIMYTLGTPGTVRLLCNNSWSSTLHIIAHLLCFISRKSLLVHPIMHQCQGPNV